MLNFVITICPLLAAGSRDSEDHQPQELLRLSKAESRSHVALSSLASGAFMNPHPPHILHVPVRMIDWFKPLETATSVDPHGKGILKDAVGEIGKAADGDQARAAKVLERMDDEQNNNDKFTHLMDGDTSPQRLEIAMKHEINYKDDDRMKELEDLAFGRSTPIESLDLLGGAENHSALQDEQPASSLDSLGHTQGDLPEKHADGRDAEEANEALSGWEGEHPDQKEELERDERSLQDEEAGSTHQGDGPTEEDGGEMGAHQGDGSTEEDGEESWNAPINDRHAESLTTVQS